MCCTRLAGNARPKKIAKNSPSGHHRTTLSGYIFVTKATIGKKLLNISPTCPYNMVNFVPKNHCIRWGSRPPHVKEQFWWRKGAGHARICLACPLLSHPKGLSKGQQHRCVVRCGWQLGCTKRGAHRRNLANTVEPSVCCGDGTSCQITFTSTFYELFINQSINQFNSGNVIHMRRKTET